MRILNPIGALVCGLLTSAGVAEVPETPNEADVPKPVPIEVDLAGSDPPDIARFLNVRSATSPSLSPDGSILSFRSGITGRPQLWVVAAASGWPRQLTFGESVTFNEWSPRGDWIAYGSDRGGDEREGFYLVSPDGTRERQLLAPSEAFRVFGGFSPDGSKIAYATTERNGIDFDIHLLTVETGEDREVYQGKFGFFVGAWRPDGGALVLSETRGEDANNVHLLDLESLELTTLFNPEVAAAYTGFAWKPDGSGFYLSTNQDRDFAALAYYNARTSKLAFLETPDHDVSDVGLSRDGRFLSWAANVGGYSELYVRNLEDGSEVAPPDMPPGVRSMSWADKASIAAVVAVGPKLPGDIWIWNATSGIAHRATHSNLAGLDPGKLVTPTHVDFQARDGETLYGLLYLPASLEAGKKPPVLLSVHGGPTSQARPRFNGAKQYLLARGIAVFDLNFRGSTGYGKRFTRLDNKRLRPNSVLDMEDAMRWLAEDGRVDTSRAAVMGASYGGFMSFAAVTTFPDLFDAAVSFVGVSNWITALEGASPGLKASDRLEYGDINDPGDREFFRQISPIIHIDKVKTPIMVLHGANDPRDPVSESDEFVRGVRENGGEVEYLRFPDEGHGIRKLENRLIAYRRIADFLERELGMTE